MLPIGDGSRGARGARAPPGFYRGGGGAQGGTTFERALASRRLRRGGSAILDSVTAASSIYIGCEYIWHRKLLMRGCRNLSEQNRGWVIDFIMHAHAVGLCNLVNAEVCIRISYYVPPPKFYCFLRLCFLCVTITGYRLYIAAY